MATYTVEWDKDEDDTFSEDISSYVMDVHIDRGRKTDLETMPPGYATLVLNNADGRFSPDYADGAYFEDTFMYSRVRIKVTHDGSTYGLFFGHVIGWDNKPKTTEQTVTWFLGDRFAIWQDMSLNLPLIYQVPIKCALDLAMSRAWGNNECDNSSVETDLTDYAGLQAITPTRDLAMKIEGDYSVCCNCPGDNAGEGWRFDATGDVVTGKPIFGRIWVKATETVTLVFRAFDSVSGQRGTPATVSVGTTPTLLAFTGIPGFVAESSHYFELYTDEASEVMFWSDGLYFATPPSAGGRIDRDLDDGTAEIELAASYRQPALEIVQAIAESEPRSFFFAYCDNTNYIEHVRFRDKDWRDTAILAGPVATFSDDGDDVPYHDLILGEDAIDLVSEVEVVSQGDFLDENEEVTVWELSPTGQLVAATETINFRARYSQPARDCSLVIDPMLETFEIPAEASDGYAGYGDPIGEGWPPDTWASNTTEDQAMIGSTKTTIFMRRRTYLRFDTSGIPDVADITSAKLRLCLKVDATATDFVLRIRDKAWLAGGLLEGDWSAVPGNDALVGEFDDTGDLPSVDQWFEITIDDLTKIDKTGDTEWYLSSDREEAATEPAGPECIYIWTYQTAAKRPTLIVNYSGLPQGSSTLDNYGVGADISITAGASPLYVTAVEVKGKPLKGTSEEAKVIAAAPSPPPVDRTLSVALPLQGSRTASMETEATRLAARYDGRIRRPALVLRPKTDAVLTQMLVRELGELVHLENIGSAYGTWIDGNYWIEGITHDFQPGGEHETIFYLEEV